MLCLKSRVYVCRKLCPQANLQDLLPARADTFSMPDTLVLMASTGSSFLLPLLVSVFDNFQDDLLMTTGVTTGVVFVLGLFLVPVLMIFFSP